MTYNISNFRSGSTVLIFNFYFFSLNNINNIMVNLKNKIRLQIKQLKPILYCLYCKGRYNSFIYYRVTYKFIVLYLLYLLLIINLHAKNTFFVVIVICDTTEFWPYFKMIILQRTVKIFVLSLLWCSHINNNGDEHRYSYVVQWRGF